MDRFAKALPGIENDATLDVEEDLRSDETSDSFDWDEITATTQPDFEAGRFAFNTDDYPTEEAAMAAMDALVEEIIKEGAREIAAQAALDASRP